MKDKLQALASWVFVCFGITMIGVSILVVPANAFADEYDPCRDACCEAAKAAGGECDTMKNKSYMDCLGECFDCVNNCGSNEACKAACAQQQTPGCLSASPSPCDNGCATTLVCIGTQLGC